MTFILMIVVYLNNDDMITYQEFTNAANCNKARSIFVKSKASYRLAVCIEK